MDIISASAAPAVVMTLVKDPNNLKRFAFARCKDSDNAPIAAHQTIDVLLEHVSTLRQSFIRDRIVETIEELALYFGTETVVRGDAVIAVCATDGSVHGFPLLVKKLRNRAPTANELTTIVTRYCASPGQHPDKTERILREQLNRLSKRNAKSKALAAALRAQLSLALNGPHLLTKQR